MSMPDYHCPICLHTFRVLKKMPILFDPEDIAQHYWWHKLEKLAVAPGANKENKS